MTGQSRILDAYEALLAIIKTADTTATIYDGPQTTWLTAPQVWLVGVEDPLNAAMNLSVDAGSQDWASLGAQSRDEMFTILSTLVCWNGDSDPVAARAAAKVSLTAVQAALRPGPFGGTGDGQLGGVLAPTGWCGSAVTKVETIQGPDGFALHVQFAVVCQVRI